MTAPHARDRALEAYRKAPRRAAPPVLSGRAGVVHGPGRNAIDAERNDELLKRAAVCEACTDEACGIKTCTGCRRRALLSNPGMVCPADPPKWGPIALPRIRKIGWVLSARNEGVEVSRTVMSLRWALVRPETELLIVVVDDGSRDGSCANLSAHVIHNETAQGTALSQEAGMKAALAWGAEVVGFSDAHMRFDPELLEVLADKALSERCLVQGLSRGFDILLPCGLICQLWRAKSGIIEAKWCDPLVAGPWAKGDAPMGASVAASRETILAMSVPTGRFWDNVAGAWGYQEETLAMKAGLMGVPIYVSSRWGTFHMYRQVNPFAGSWPAKNLNIGWALALYFSPETYGKHFRKPVERILGPAVERQVFHAAEGAITRPWSPADEERFIEGLEWKAD